MNLTSHETTQLYEQTRVIIELMKFRKEHTIKCTCTGRDTDGYEYAGEHEFPVVLKEETKQLTDILDRLEELVWLSLSLKALKREQDI